MPDVYGTLAGFQTYHTERGRDITGYSDSEINAALIVGSEWLDARYQSEWVGLKVGAREQIREWPRTGAYDVYGYAIADDEVPTEVINATYEATLRECASPGSLATDYTPSKYRTVSIDGAVSVSYADRTAWDVQKQFPAIDQILSGIIGGYGRSALSGGSYRV